MTPTDVVAIIDAIGITAAISTSTPADVLAIAALVIIAMLLQPSHVHSTSSSPVPSATPCFSIAVTSPSLRI